MASSTDGYLVGFICPICKTNFASADLLVKHYATHKEDDSEHNITRRINVGSSMDIFDKTIELQTSSHNRVFGEHSQYKRPATMNEADSSFNISRSIKKIFTTLDRVFTPTSKNTRPITISEAELRRKDLLELFNGNTDNEKVKLVSRSHTDHFAEFRSAKIRNQGKETDVILENLGKYLNNQKQDKSVSIWQKLKSEFNTEIDNGCFYCKKHFKMTRRKHHCKLCEAMLCENCSLFVDANMIGIKLSRIDAIKEVPAKNAKPLRHCKDCSQLIDVIKARSNQDDHDSKFMDTYRELQNLKRQLAKTVVTYKEIHKSLWKEEGELTHDLSQAEMVRENIGRRGREIAVLGKAIGDIPVQAGTRHAKLYATIKKATDDFVKELLALPKAPSADAIKDTRRLSSDNASRRSSGLEWEDMILG